MITDAIRELLGTEPHMALMYFMCVVIGVMMNWAKRARELDVGLIEYWTSNKARSQTAIVGTFCAYVFTLITDPESGRVIDANAAFVKALGATRDDLIGRTTIELGFFHSETHRRQFVQKLFD
ncbi:MAG: PAS domain-containing protein, partial [Spirochaetia bacterium]|nr:PAS domain-containing protein [Spirochaetia bacterium]